MRALAEVRRLLVPAGMLAICHYDWLPLAGNVVAATERLIQANNPDWPRGGGTGFYPQWATDAALAGFAGLETFSFVRTASYSHQAWRGRIRASAGVGGRMCAPRVGDLDAEELPLFAQDIPAKLYCGRPAGCALVG